jgi:hypothetical protein
MGFRCECPFCTRKVQCNHLTFCSTAEYPRFFGSNQKKVGSPQYCTFYTRNGHSQRQNVDGTHFQAHSTYEMPKWTGILPTNAAKRGGTRYTLMAYPAIPSGKFILYTKRRHFVCGNKRNEWKLERSARFGGTQHHSDYKTPFHIRFARARASGNTP